MSQIYRFTLRTYQDVTIRFPNGWLQGDIRHYYERRPDEIKKLIEEYGNTDCDDEIEFLGYEGELEPEDMEDVPDYDAAAPSEQPSQGGQ